MSNTLNKIEGYYNSDTKETLNREYGSLSHMDNPFNGKWVYRKNGEYIDCDTYFNDLCERHNIEVI